MSTSSFAHSTAAAGAKPVEVRLLNYSDTATTPGDARAEVQFNSSGSVDVLRLSEADSLALYNWLKYGSGASWEIRLTLAAGTLSTGSSAAGVWLSMGSNRKWGVERSVLGVSQISIEVELRNTANNIVYASNMGTMTANVEA